MSLTEYTFALFHYLIMHTHTSVLGIICNTGLSTPAPLISTSLRQSLSSPHLTSCQCAPSSGYSLTSTVFPDVWNLTPCFLPGQPSSKCLVLSVTLTFPTQSLIRVEIFLFSSITLPILLLTSTVMFLWR